MKKFIISTASMLVLSSIFLTPDAMAFKSAPPPAAGKVFDISNGFADLVEALQPAVINVSTTQNQSRGRDFYNGSGDIEEFFNFFFNNPFGMPQQPAPRRQIQPRQSLGSGFIISEEGYALTNYHVVENAETITIKLYDEREFPAKIIGSDKESDVALLQIQLSGKEKLPAVSLGNSDNLRIGDWAIAIGNPFGLNHTVTAGIISAKERNIGAGPYDQFIQTDASINPGNSGGPLFNIKGEVIGINTAIVAQGQGIGFAIPINVAHNIVDQILDKGRVAHGWLGVSAQALAEDLADYLGHKDTSGALISDVFADSPAAKAGIKSGDIITAVNGKKIRNPEELTRTIGTLSPGSKVQLSIWRDNKNITLQLTLADREKGLDQANNDYSEKETVETKSNKGLQAELLTARHRQRLGLNGNVKGVIINNVEPDSPFANVLKKNDILLQINKMEITNLEDFNKIIKNLKKGQKCLFHIWRNGGSIYIATKLPE